MEPIFADIRRAAIEGAVRLDWPPGFAR